MRYPLYAIRDLKGEFYSPRMEQNEASAKRNFAMMVNTEQTIINFAPQDFELYMIGSYDASTGTLEPIGMPEFILRASDVVGAYNA